MQETVDAGRQAIEAYDWDRALEAFVAADREDGLGPDDLILLADAQWWLGSLEDAERSLERAYAGFLDQGLKTDAALVAASLAYMAFRRLATSVGSGWVSRTEHLVESEPESSANAWLALHRLNQAMMFENDMEGAVRLADEAFDVATRTNTPEVRSLALSLKGMAKVMMGEWREGMSLIDEAVVMAISEQKNLRATSNVYCITIAACSELADYRRAKEWTDRAEKWMHERGVGGYPGVCQVHRAELKLLRGDWPDALEEAQRACRELERFSLFFEVGFARYEIGEVKRRMGDLAGADEAFSGAYEYGHPAQPGMSLLLLDRGQVDDAVRSIAAALEQASGPGSRRGNVSLMRGSLLPAQVEISLAADDIETAVSAAEELEEVARVFESPAWHARAMTCRGAVELHRGNLNDAIDGLGRAWRLWQDLGLPYENARSRELLGRARLAQGDTMGAGLELKAAHSTFSRLGAKRDLSRVAGLMGEANVAVTSDRARNTKTFMFTDIVGSTELISLVGDEAWGSLKEWHDRSLRDCFRRHQGEEINQMGDGFFVAFDDPREALDCAVEIQRRLAEHRREHGFAPWVRIGLHTAEATRQGDDYTGAGVHAAARVGDLGEREEIVVSAPTLGAIGEVSLPVSEPRTLTLKGVSGPIEVHTIDWR